MRRRRTIWRHDSARLLLPSVHEAACAAAELARFVVSSNSFVEKRVL